MIDDCKADSGVIFFNGSPKFAVSTKFRRHNNPHKVSFDDLLIDRYTIFLRFLSIKGENVSVNTETQVMIVLFF